MLISAEKRLQERRPILLPEHGARSLTQLTSVSKQANDTLLMLDVNRELQREYSMSCQLRIGRTVLLRLCFRRGNHRNRPPCPPPHLKHGPVHMHRYVAGQSDFRAPCIESVETDVFQADADLVTVLHRFVNYCNVRGSGTSVRGLLS